jgi:hypothetical protein
MKSSLDKKVVCIIGLGYVGLPLAEAFAGSFQVTGYDTDIKKIKTLKENNRQKNLLFTSKAEDISKADYLRAHAGNQIQRPGPVLRGVGGGYGRQAFEKGQHGDTGIHRLPRSYRGNS